MSNFKRVVNVIPLTAVNLGGTQIFTYLVPLELQDKLRPGQLVRVSFGGRRVVMGLVSSFEMHRLPKEVKGLKPILELITPLPVISEKHVALANWLARYYVTPLGLAVKAMLPKFVNKPKDPEITGYERFNPDYVLTDHQKHAVAAITRLLGTSATVLLHGITGSGKTEVYMQVIERVLEAGQQVIVLVPEISLTTQAIERFARRFGIEKIALMHSRLKDSERLFMWQKIWESEKQIVIGPRSAVFAPVQNLGLIIIDEEHDPSFKQYDQHPKYHAREVARKLSELWHCPLVFGDATPSVASYYSAVLNTDGKTQILKLPDRIMADVGLPKVRVVDMRKEIASKNFSIFSEALKAEMIMKLKQNKQIILFLNRRGAATFVLCRDCAFVSFCAHCQVPLVYHLTTQNLICHHCGKIYEIPVSCPSCGSARIKYFGIGTEAVEEELKKFLTAELKDKDLPVIVRMDRDSTAKPDAHKRIYEDWVAGKTRVLIGTQMISKGWDVSHVGLVGIVSADTILHLPDYRSNERTFQVLTQVAGRAGRGSDPGTVILQTYNPENFAIQAAKSHDYEGFFAQEIEVRKKFFYPPFSKLIKLVFSHPDSQKALEQAERAAQILSEKKSAGMEIIGPIPSFILKLRGRYRFQIILRAHPNTDTDFYSLLQDMPDADIDIDPESLL